MYGLRGCEPCVSCMGLGLLKELKFLKVGLKKLKSAIIANKKAKNKSQHQLNRIGLYR